MKNIFAWRRHNHLSGLGFTNPELTATFASAGDAVPPAPLAFQARSISENLKSARSPRHQNMLVEGLVRMAEQNKGPLEERIICTLETANTLEMARWGRIANPFVDKLHQDVNGVLNSLTPCQRTNLVEKIGTHIKATRDQTPWYSERLQKQLVGLFCKTVDIVTTANEKQTGGCADRLCAAMPAYRGLDGAADLDKKVRDRLNPYLSQKQGSPQELGTQSPNL